MADFTITLDDELARRVALAARDAGVSVSTWLVTLLRERTEDAWSDEARAAIGCWPEFPFADRLRADSSDDLPRDGLESA